MTISEDTILIKSEAYVKMLIHVLRFGSDDLDKKLWKEAMGACVGKIEKDQVVVYDAIPMTHGRRIEVKWEENDYARFQMLENTLSEGHFVVGWYHSHPGMGAFLSAADKVNHFFWQEVNPKAMAIVFDHTMLAEENNDGFEIFRLNDVSLADKSDFHGVKFIVEPPPDKSIYRKFVEIANNLHRDDPIMTEEGEVVDFFDGMTIGTAQKPEADDVKAYVINNTTMVLQTIRDLKSSMTTGLTRLQNWFSKGLREGIADPLGDLEYQQWRLLEDIKNKMGMTDEEEAKPEETTEEKSE